MLIGVRLHLSACFQRFICFKLIFFVAVFFLFLPQCKNDALRICSLPHVAYVYSFSPSLSLLGQVCSRRSSLPLCSPVQMQSTSSTCLNKQRRSSEPNKTSKHKPYAINPHMHIQILLLMDVLIIDALCLS